LLIFCSEEFILSVCEQYGILRVDGIDHENAFKNPDGTFKEGVTSVSCLNTSSFEIVILKRYIPDFVSAILMAFPGSVVDPSHDPFEPSTHDLGPLDGREVYNDLRFGT
jgi:hypothetical protein